MSGERQSTSGIFGVVGILSIVLVAVPATDVYAADGFSMGTLEADVALGRITLGDLVEPLQPVGNNSKKCRIDQSTSTHLLNFSASAGNPAISLQRGSIGIDTTSGQGCGFAVGGETLSIELGADVSDVASVIDFAINFIVTDEAVFELIVRDADGNVLPADSGAGYSYRVYTGKNACDPIGTNGVERTGGINEISRFACTAQSNPNSRFETLVSKDDFDVDTGDWRSVEIHVLEGEVGITTMSLELGMTATGTLTCEEDLSPGDATTTTVSEIFDVGGGVQCRRLPNRNGAACEPVPYVLDSDCAGSGCSIEFLHGDQPTVQIDRENYAFLCEVWWPPRASQLSANSEGQLTPGDVLPKTIIEWGVDGSPGATAPGDAGGQVTYCDGITPLFSAPVEPNSATSCGTSVSYLLSQPAVPGPLTNGGTVAPDSTECSLLEAYDDVLLPTAFPDQCEDDPDCPAGKQVACLVDSRISQVEDPDANCQGMTGDCSTLGPVNPGDVTSTETLLQNYELIYIGGDLLMRRL